MYRDQYRKFRESPGKEVEQNLDEEVELDVPVENIDNSNFLNKPNEIRLDVQNDKEMRLN